MHEPIHLWIVYSMNIKVIVHPKNKNDPFATSHPRCIWLSSFRLIQSELYALALQSFIMAVNGKLKDCVNSFRVYIVVYKWLHNTGLCANSRARQILKYYNNYICNIIIYLFYNVLNIWVWNFRMYFSNVFFCCLCHTFLSKCMLLMQKCRKFNLIRIFLWRMKEVNKYMYIRGSKYIIILQI